MEYTSDGIHFDALTHDYAVVHKGELQGYRSTVAEALELEAEATANYDRHLVAQAASTANTTAPLALPMAA